MSTRGSRSSKSRIPTSRVDWIHIPDAADQQVALKTAIAGGNAPDVFWSTPFRDFVALGAAMDVTEQLAADPVLGAPDYFLQPQETERATVNGKWFGIGSCWVAPHIYYNADLLAEAGIDPPSPNPAEAWTFDHFREVGRQLTIDNEGRHPGDEGFDVNNVRQWGVSWPTFDIALAAAIYSNGGYTWGTDYTAGHGSPEALQAIQAIADLTNVDQIAPVPAALEQMGMSDWQALANGNVAIIINGSWALQDICQARLQLRLRRSSRIPGTSHGDAGPQSLDQLDDRAPGRGLEAAGIPVVRRIPARVDQGRSLASEPHLAADPGRHRLLDDGGSAPGRLRPDRHRLRWPTTATTSSIPPDTPRPTT